MLKVYALGLSLDEDSRICRLGVIENPMDMAWITCIAGTSVRPLLLMLLQLALSHGSVSSPETLNLHPKLYTLKPKLHGKSSQASALRPWHVMSCMLLKANPEDCFLFKPYTIVVSIFSINLYSPYIL